MSGSRDKQRRKKRGGGFDLGQNDKDFQQAEAKRKQTKKAVTTLLIIAVVAVIVLVLNSNLFYRNMTALRVGDTRFSITDMNFYLSQVALQGGGFDEAANMAQQSALLHQRAVAEGLTISPELQEEADETVRFFREDFGDHMFDSAGGFVIAQFGRGMNLRILRERVEFDALGRTYVNHFFETLMDSYSEADLEEYYLEHRDYYDRVLFRLYEFPLETEEAEDGEYEIPVTLPATIDEDEDADDAEDAEDADDADEAEDSEDAEDADDADETEDAEDAEEAEIVEVPVDALGAAQFVLAAAEADGEEGFLSALATATGQTEASIAALTNNNEARIAVSLAPYGEWLLNDSRQAGDTTLIEDEEFIYVLYFLGVEDNRYYTSNVRHLLIRPEEVGAFDEDMDPLEFATLHAAAMVTARERAEEILAEWRAGDATEESFAELVREYSDDYRGEPEPGLFEEINRQTGFVPEFLDWAVDPSRRAGDVEIVETQFGFHIMFFSGHNTERYHRHTLAAIDMSSAAFTDWLDEATEANPPQRTFFARLVG